MIKESQKYSKKEYINRDSYFLKDIVWGSRLFVNSQFVCNLVILLAHYYQGECTLSYLLRFIHAVQKQQKVKLYKELQIELEEFIEVETCLDNDAVITYCVNRLFQNITEGRIRKNG